MTEEEKTIEKQKSIIEKQRFKIEAQEMEHDYDVKMIDEVKGEANKLYKMIDLMAEQLSTPINSKEWVKEYYRKKAEE